MYPELSDNALDFQSFDRSVASDAQKIINEIKRLNSFNDTTPVMPETEKLVVAMRQLFVKSIASGEFFSLLSNIIHQPQSWLTNINACNDDDSASRNTYLLVGLFECACHHTRLFDRLQTIRRLDNENRIIDLARQTTDNLPCHRFNYLSLGSGGCLQELCLVIKLIQNGFTNINMHLIEPKLGEQENPYIEAEQNFRYLINALNNELNTTINICVHHSLISCITQVSTPFHLITALDFDELPYSGLPDLLLCQQSLADNLGAVFISWLNFDFTLFNNHGMMHRHDPDNANYYLADSEPYRNPGSRTSLKKLQMDTGVDIKCFRMLKASKANHAHLNILMMTSSSTFDMICEILLPYLYNHPQAKTTQLTLGVLSNIDESIDPQYLQPFLSTLLHPYSQTINVQPIVNCLDYFASIPQLGPQDIVMFQPELFEIDNDAGSLFTCLCHHFPNALIINVEDSASSQQQLLPNPFGQCLWSHWPDSYQTEENDTIQNQSLK